MQIDFSKHPPFKEVEKTFTLVAKKNTPGFYYKGLFFTNGENSLNKGEALTLMLQEATVPQVLIMVDNCQKNLEAIEEELKRTFPTIEFIGILFQGALDASEPCTESEFKTFWEEAVKQAQGS